MSESWRAVVGYEGVYEVSDRGRVRSLDRVTTSGRRWKGRVRKQVWTGPRWSKYLCVMLSWANEVKCAKVHLLVLEAFTGPRPTELQARHLDGDASNNRQVNLAWGTAGENTDDKHRHERVPAGEQHHNAKLTAAQVRRIRARCAAGDLQASVACDVKISVAQVSRICSRKRWSHVK